MLSVVDYYTEQTLAGENETLKKAAAASKAQDDARRKDKNAARTLEVHCSDALAYKMRDAPFEKFNISLKVALSACKHILICTPDLVVT